MSTYNTIAVPDPKPTGEALAQLARAVAALTPDPLPDLSHLQSFRNASNLACLGYPQSEPRHRASGQTQHAERDQNCRGPEMRVQQDHGGDQVPSAISLPENAIRGTKRKRTRDPDAALKPNYYIDPQLLAGKQMLVEAYLFDASLSDSATSAPWHYLGIASLNMTYVKRPADLLELTITALGGQEAVVAPMSKQEPQTNDKLRGATVVWGRYHEPGRKTTERWNYCVAAILKAFLVDWVARENKDNPDDVKVKVLLWRHEDARKARTARRKHIPMKPAEAEHES